jgi:hypothetical protein
MTALFKKLNFKQQQEIVVLNHPKSFENELVEIKKVTSFVTKLTKLKEVEFVLVFVTTLQEIETTFKQLNPLIKGDATIWICYPKGSSKNYTCNFNRDTGWQALAKYDLEPVRQVAIDEDWSALRFRKVAFIKTITRRESFALTAKAKSRTTQKGK